MTRPEFDAFLAIALGVCRSAARVELPIEEMLAGVEAAIERAGELGLETHPGVNDLEALREIISAVGEVAAIGSRLPPESRPVRVPAPPEGGYFPVPANVLREA